MTVTQCLAWQTLIGAEFYTAHRHIVGVIYDMTHMQPILYGAENKKKPFSMVWIQCKLPCSFERMI